MIAFPCTDLDGLAATYARMRRACDRERLCEAAMPLVRRIAAAVYRRLPRHFGIDDLIGDGCVGLLRAIDRFDPAFGVSFESWAARVIRGSMLNGLRRMDAIPERVRRDARTLEDARWALAQATGYAPSETEAAQCARLTPGKLDAVREAKFRAALLAIEGPPPSGSGGVPIGERLVSSEPDPAAQVARAAVHRIVDSAIGALPHRERAIVEAFYGRRVTFNEIGRVLGVSKQRVSQLHNRAIAGLRARLSELASES